MQKPETQRGRRAVPAESLHVREAETGAELGLLADVSLNGACVRGCRYLPQDMRLFVEIEVPRDAHHKGPIVATARVAWCRADPAVGGHEVGLELLHLRRDAELALAELFYRRSV